MYERYRVRVTPRVFEASTTEALACCFVRQVLANGTAIRKANVRCRAPSTSHPLNTLFCMPNECVAPLVCTGPAGREAAPLRRTIIAPSEARLRTL